VRIESLTDGRTYLGAVVEGPFAEPDGLRADSTPMVVSTVQGGILMPKYHGRVQVEIVGERLEEGGIVPPRRRPKPNSPVFPLDAKETAEVLQIQDNLRLGLADGFEDLPVFVPAYKKSVFPRHLGVLGTTGGGKSTTVSGLVAKAQREQMAIILIDTEGEYCAINDPTDDKQMLQALRRQKLEPAGVENTHIYHLVQRDTKNPGHPSVTPFSIRFCDLSPYAVQEILELNDAQEERFFKAYDITKVALERFKIWPRTSEEKARLLEIDELETGYPEMKLSHLYDVVALIAAEKNHDSDPFLETEVFNSKKDELKGIIQAAQTQGNGPSWRKLQGKLGLVKWLKFSTRERPFHSIMERYSIRDGSPSLI
jgi:hypothetical protein